MKDNFYSLLNQMDYIIQKNMNIKLPTNIFDILYLYIENKPELPIFKVNDNTIYNNIMDEIDNKSKEIIKKNIINFEYEDLKAFSGITPRQRLRIEDDYEILFNKITNNEYKNWSAIQSHYFVDKFDNTISTLNMLNIFDNLPKNKVYELLLNSIENFREILFDDDKMFIFNCKKCQDWDCKKHFF